MMQAGEFGQLFEMAKSAGPWGLLSAYLLYKDLYKPWRNGKANGKWNAPSPSPFNPKDFALERDVSELATSFREFRREANDHHSDLSGRILRLEIRMDGHEREERQ